MVHDQNHEHFTLSTHTFHGFQKYAHLLVPGKCMEIPYGPSVRVHHQFRVYYVTFNPIKTLRIAKLLKWWGTQANTRLCFVLYHFFEANFLGVHYNKTGTSQSSDGKSSSFLKRRSRFHTSGSQRRICAGRWNGADFSQCFTFCQLSLHQCSTFIGGLDSEPVRGQFST
jgi:hypothetical protein